MKHRLLACVLRHNNLVHEGKLSGKAARGRKRMESLYEMMEGRDYGQLKLLLLLKQFIKAR